PGSVRPPAGPARRARRPWSAGRRRSATAGRWSARSPGPAASPGRPAARRGAPGTGRSPARPRPRRSPAASSAPARTSAAADGGAGAARGEWSSYPDGTWAAARYPTGVAGASRWGALRRELVRGPSPLPARQVDARPALPGRGRQQARDVTVTSRIAVTSMRAGDPRTEPQLSGRGGEDAPWR